MTTETPVDTAALDAWLAEHLFNAWTCESCTAGTIAWSGRHWHFPSGMVTSSLVLSRTGDGMLMVLEAMKERGWDWHIESAEGAWWLRLEHDDGREVGYSPFDGNSTITATALSIAAALAAKAALEAEVS